MIYTIRVARTEVYIEDVDVEAESIDLAIDQVQDALDKGGWDVVFPHTEGEYQSCECDVIVAELKETS